MTPKGFKKLISNIIMIIIIYIFLNSVVWIAKLSLNIFFLIS